MILAVVLALPWIADLTAVLGTALTWFIITGLAIIPGGANSFLLSSLIMDKRPQYHSDDLPPVSILVAAYNEEDTIASTLRSIAIQEYPNKIEVIVVNDCSTDRTREIAMKASAYLSTDQLSIKVISCPANFKKAGALNLGLKEVSHQYLITIDADTILFKSAIKNIVTNITQGPHNTGAVAGSILVNNVTDNWLTRMQEWDYFLGIATVKRTQSLYEGTLVAQGAFSIYQTAVVRELGGWAETVGEDIVLTWGIHERGYKVGYAENAIAFTNVPDNYKQFFRQRERWSRGLIEAFKQYPEVIWKLKKNSPFIFLNLLFPYIDFTFLFFFLPGVIAALVFEYYLLAGLLTLLLLPLAFIGNYLMFRKQNAIMKQGGVKLKDNRVGMIMYAFLYQIIMTPACLSGYVSEFFKLRKKWGTK
jgi:biofilm PGA synthesis N-glycosyltransferase PgaC